MEVSHPAGTRLWDNFLMKSKEGQLQGCGMGPVQVTRELIWCRLQGGGASIDVILPCRNG